MSVLSMPGPGRRWIPGLAVSTATTAAAGATLLPRVPDAPGGFWLAALWVTWLAAMTWALTRRTFPVIFTALTLSEFIFIVVPATGAQAYGATLLGGNDYHAGVTSALKICVAAQVAMLAGAAGARALRPVRGFCPVAVTLSASRLDRVLTAAAVTGAAGAAAASAAGGGPLRDFFVYATPGGYGTAPGDLHANAGFLVAVQCVAALTLTLLPLRLGRASSRRGRALALTAAGLASLVLLGAGQRGPFVAAATAAGLVWLKTRGSRRHQRAMLAAGALVLLAITAVAGAARSPEAYRVVTVSSVAGQPGGPGNNLFLPLAGLAETVPSQVGYLHGASYLQAFVLPVPRVLWPSKPADDISVLISRFDPQNSGFAFPAFGEGYADFGYPGVVLCGLLLGAAAAALDRRFALSRDVRAGVMAAVWAAVVLQLFSRGVFAPMFTTYMGFLGAAAYVSRRRSRVLAPVTVPVLGEACTDQTTAWPWWAQGSWRVDPPSGPRARRTASSASRLTG
jgi:hypothetical protein